MKKFTGVMAQTPFNGVIPIGIDGHDPSGQYCGGSWGYHRIAQVNMDDFPNPTTAWKMAEMMAKSLNRHAEKIRKLVGDHIQHEASPITSAAAAMGRVKSDRKTASSRENGKKGGRPKTKKEE